MPRTREAELKRPVRLVWYFLTASVVALALVTLGVGWGFALSFRRVLLREHIRFAEAIASHLGAELRLHFTGPVTEGGGRIDLAAPEQRARFDRAARGAVAGLEVKRVFLFDLDGNVIYSTVRSLGTKAGAENPLFERAARGEVAAKVVERSEALDAGGSADADLLKVYVPLRGPGGAQTGVVEIYRNAQNLQRDLRAMIVRVALISSSGMVVTIWVLLWIFLRGDRLIRKRTGELLRANAQLADLTESLEAKVEDRTSQLIDRERLAMLGSLASGIAHEVNNPLASVTSAAEALLRRARRGQLLDDEKEVEEYLEIILEEAFRAKAITRDLLNVARKEREDEHYEPVQVNEVVRAVGDLLRLRPGFREGSLSLELFRDERLPEVLGSASRLRQVIFNVTDNALDALGERGTKVTWRTRTEMDTGGRQLVRLTCVDDGDGMTREVRERIFEPFYTTKDPGSGTGLGLAICRTIIETHAGTISIEPAEYEQQADGDQPGSGGWRGRGTVVTIRIPTAATREKEKRYGGPGSRPAGGR